LLLLPGLLLRPRLLLLPLIGPAIAAVRPLPAGLAVAPLLEAPLLLAVAVLVAWRASVAPAVAAFTALPLRPLIAPRFAAPRLLLAALPLLRGLLRVGRSNGRRRGRLGSHGRLEDAENPREQALRCGRGGLHHLLRCLLRR
jgi:hypothetical protein